MRVMDNSPIDVPAVGRLVKEKYAVDQLTDCCFYVLLSTDSAIAEDGKDVFDKLLQSIGEKQLLNRYDYHVLEKLPPLNHHPLLENAINEEQSQFIMPLYTPSKADKQFLLLKTEPLSLYTDLALMVYTSERISKHSVNEVLFKYALESPDAFCDDLKDVVKTEKFWKNYFSSLAAGFFKPTFMGIQATLPSIREVLQIDGVITYKKKREMMSRMKENIYKYIKYNDKKAEAELNYVLNSLDAEFLKVLLKHMPKGQLDTFYKTASDIRQAEESKVKLEVRYVGKSDIKHKGDGKYRLFMLKDYDQIQVHFSRREAFILYLIYLIDKYNNDDVDTLNIKEYKDQFIFLYNKVYGPDSPAQKFDSMVKYYDRDGNIRQPQIKHSYEDIRLAIKESCEKLGEISTPFLLANPQDHLDVLRENIIIPKELLETE